jgi:hypothetical protein
MKTFFLSLLVLISSSCFAQKSNPELSKSFNRLSINGFRNPSIGIEFESHTISVHAGYYITAFESGVTTKFFKAGVTHYMLPVDKKEVPSSFYASASYLRGLNNDYENDNAVATEVGFRWTVVKGLNIRLGVTALASPDKHLKVNPTPGISYTFNLK